MPDCDCGACCERCGHYPGCIRFEIENEENND